MSDMPARHAQLPLVIQGHLTAWSAAQRLHQTDLFHGPVASILQYASCSPISACRYKAVENLNLQLPCGQHQFMLQTKALASWLPKLYLSAEAEQRL